MQLIFVLFSLHQAAWQAGCGHACVESLDSVLTLNCARGRERLVIRSSMPVQSLLFRVQSSLGKHEFMERWASNLISRVLNSCAWPQEQWRETGLRCEREGNLTTHFTLDAATKNTSGGTGTGRLYVLPESDLRGLRV